MSGSMTERLRPSLLAQVQIGSISAGTQTVPGGMSEILTSSDLYLKYPALTQELRTSKPWLAIPVSALSKSSGIDLGQIFSQADRAAGPLDRVPAARRRPATCGRSGRAPSTASR